MTLPMQCAGEPVSSARDLVMAPCPSLRRHSISRRHYGRNVSQNRESGGAGLVIFPGTAQTFGATADVCSEVPHLLETHAPLFRAAQWQRVKGGSDTHR